jgi:hypothetical protein
MVGEKLLVDKTASGPTAKIAAGVRPVILILTGLHSQAL